MCQTGQSTSPTSVCPAPRPGGRERDERFADLYGAFPVKRLFLGSAEVFCSERERPFFVLSPAIRFPERAEGVKGPNGSGALAACHLSEACVSQRLDP